MKRGLNVRSFVIGFGLGILICTIVLYLYTRPIMSEYYIENKARGMGMMYPDEIKTYFENN